MRLSLTAWSFPLCTLAEAAAIGKALGIGALDLGLLHGARLDKARLLAEPQSLADEVRRLEIDCPSYYHLFGASPQERHLADPAGRSANEADFRQVLAFCAAAGIGTVFVLPGVCDRGQDRRRALEQSASSLSALARLAVDAGIVLTVEPHVGGLLESPLLTRALIEQVPGLKLTLDYAHFACLGYPQDEIDPLAPHAAHIHLRQARPGALQCRLEHGTLNFAALLGTLAQHRYGGHLAIEYVHQDYMGTLNEDVLSETIKMRDLVRQLLREASPGDPQ